MLLWTPTLHQPEKCCKENRTTLNVLLISQSTDVGIYCNDQLRTIFQIAFLSLSLLSKDFIEAGK